MCIELDLIAGNVLFVDGTKIRANASISNSYTKDTARKVLANIDKRIDKLIAICEQADADEEGSLHLRNCQKAVEMPISLNPGLNQLSNS